MTRKFLMGTLKDGLDNMSRRNIGFEGRKIGFRLTHRYKGRCSTRILKKKCFCTINSNVDKKCILFHTEIIFRSGSKDFALIHYTFSSTNKFRSVSESFPRWVFLIISRKLLVRTRSPKILIFRSRIGRLSQEYIISRFLGSAWYFDCSDFESTQLARTPGTHTDGSAVTRKPGNA